MELQKQRQQGECGYQKQAAHSDLFIRPEKYEPKKCQQSSNQNIPVAVLHKSGIVSQFDWVPVIAPARICNLLKLFNRILLPTLLLAGLLLTGCAGRAKKIKLPPPVKGKIGWTERGVASWYGHPYHGRITSNGEVYDMNKMTAAHKRLPFNTWVRVTNLDNKQITIVRINDRGPFVGKRIIDLSRAAATDINMIVSGTALVQLKVIRPQKGKNPPSSRKSSTRQQPQPQSQQNFDIQIGVFSDRNNARNAVNKASELGLDAAILEYTQSGQRRYRVLVTGGSRQQANSKLQRLKSRGFDGFLRPR